MVDSVFHKIERMKEPVREATSLARQSLAQRGVNIEKDGGLDILNFIDQSKAKQDQKQNQEKLQANEKTASTKPASRAQGPSLVGSKRALRNLTSDKDSDETKGLQAPPQKRQRKQQTQLAEDTNKETSCIKLSVSNGLNQGSDQPTRCAERKEDTTTPEQQPSPPSSVSFGHILPRVTKDNLKINSAFLESESKISKPDSVQNEKSLNSTSSLTEQSMLVLPLSSPNASEQHTSDEALWGSHTESIYQNYECYNDKKSKPFPKDDDDFIIEMPYQIKKCDSSELTSNLAAHSPRYGAMEYFKTLEEHSDFDDRYLYKQHTTGCLDDLQVRTNTQTLPSTAFYP